MVLYSSSGDSLIVNFGSQELKDMMLNKDEVLARLRFRSMPLQVDDCCHIEEGERVLVNTKLQSKDFFYDAEVEKVHFLSSHRHYICKKVSITKQNCILTCSYILYRICMVEVISLYLIGRIKYI